MGNEADIRKAPPTENLCPQPHFYLCEDGFGGGDGDGKAIPSPAPPRCHPYMLPFKCS